MNDSPGWASPGSSSSDPDPSSRPEQAEGTPDDGQEHTSPTAQDRPPQDRDSSGEPAPSDAPPRKWAADQPPADGQGWGQTGWGGPVPPHGGGPSRGHWGSAGNGQGWNRGWGQGNQGWQGWHQPGPQRGGWGPGGPGGWHGWGPPPAAKPGVVPLRPLGVGEILDGSVSAMRTHWRTALGVALGVAVFTELLYTLLKVLWAPNSTAALEDVANQEAPTFEEFNDALTQSLNGTAIEGIVSMLGTVFATAMLTIVVSRAVLGRQVTLRAAWDDSRPQLLRLLGLLILIPLLVTAAMLICLAPGLLAAVAGSGNTAFTLSTLGLLGGCVAAVWIWVSFCLAPPALMLEKQGVLAAMRRSAKLVRGSWWRVFGVQLLALLIVFLVSTVIQLPVTGIGSLLTGSGDVLATSGTDWPDLLVDGIGSVLASTVSLPLSAGITALLYMDQRIRREALDLELARAAGVPGYEEEPPGRPGPES
ncbi:DUF7544 domain-containing protein [Streptomyces sp. NRRL F-5053]|uniref:DUF7544 domain-containing protein n=1 Tax=Streptomyces sp. NRRL F-5053 TaxID=1463854 RepID=UPI000565A491|nr:hypothetical protein [Streptomyces sp. NRRL F-5053]